MLEKRELEDILVKLKLGTLSVDNAIEELQQNLPVKENRLVPIWQEFNAPFDDVIQAKNINDNQLERLVQDNLEKGITFICLSDDKAKLAKLKDRYRQLEYNINAGVIYFIHSLPDARKKSVALFCDKKINTFVAKQVECLLYLFGVKTNFFEINNDDISNALEEIAKNDIVIVAESFSSHLSQKLAAKVLKPIIVIPISISGTSCCKPAALNAIKANGIVSVGEDNALEATLAAIRI